MSNSNTQAQSGGIGFCGLLTIVFITLKLTHVINWGWKWVLAPLWIPFAIVGAVLLIGLILSFIGHLLRQRENKKRIQQRTIRSDLDRRR
jgi:TRAP-type C4-dicarboxylate transport system permease small subunit